MIKGKGRQGEKREKQTGSSATHHKPSEKHTAAHRDSERQPCPTPHVPAWLPRLELLDFLADASGLLSVPPHPKLILCNLLALFLQLLDQVISDDGQGSCGVVGQGLYH